MDYNIKDLVVTKRELNIKKVAIFIAVILLCSFTIFISFYISYKNMNRENNLGTTTVNEKQEKNNKAVNIYTGNHLQIANHNIEFIRTMTQSAHRAGYNPNAKEEIRDIYYSEEKQVYLTFDDGPSKDVTPQILDILKQENVPATFFVLGSRAEVYKDTIRREYEEGHYIANHGYSHTYSSIYANQQNVLNEYNRTEQIVRDILNIPDYKSYLFRFPGGSAGGRYDNVKKQAIELIEQNQIVHTNWNCLTGDAEGLRTKEAQMQKFLTSKKDSESIVILMHDANDKGVTVELIKELIPYLKSEGYVFKNFYDIFRAEE